MSLQLKVSNIQLTFHHNNKQLINNFKIKQFQNHNNIQVNKNNT